MKVLLWLWLWLCLFSLQVSAEEMRCDFPRKSGQAKGYALVKRSDGVPVSLDIAVFFKSEGGGMGYSCSLTANRLEKDAMWEYGKHGVQITFAEDDMLRIKKSRNGLILDLNDTRSDSRCGAGAELPTRIEIRASGKNCKVKFK